MLLPPVASYAAAEASPPPTIPTAGQALRRQQPHTAAEPVNPRSPLHAGFHCRVVPFLGLAVVHRRGALRAACSTWSRNDFHRKSNVRGEADIWVPGHSPVFCDLPSKSLCQACWATNLSRRGELSFGWPRKWPISNEKWAVKHIKPAISFKYLFFHFEILNYINFYAWRICWILY